MEQIKAIKTEIGEIHGRDAIFLDDIQFNYQKNEVKDKWFIMYRIGL
ncbi:hypothetical protein ABN764_24685 [Paenibacillaceae sp. P-4]|uniref:Uncharacterized protein n=1 Tax=Paenibacillus suaedae TaxID=3077233 RepID=A0AAJ2N8F0_9BACL|nr:MULTISPECIES: hypothetical protein [unclassified Paenibacillus]MDT8976409.1 hypothetical protein [Paenibacillus sp. chi10]GAV11668.1 hypothetical protein PBN151_1597 [Paenibacillus sp. NAIST15-1]